MIQSSDILYMLLFVCKAKQKSGIDRADRYTVLLKKQTDLKGGEYGLVET